MNPPRDPKSDSATGPYRVIDSHTETIAGFLNMMPKGVIGAMLKGVDFLASNVPGVPVPMWLVGCQVMRFFPFGPTAGSAVNITLMSYNGLCCIGVNSDSAAVPDPDVLVDCLRAGFDEVCSLVGILHRIRKEREEHLDSLASLVDMYEARMTALIS